MILNGWGHESRRSAADVFNLDYNDMDDRHHVIQVTYEEGKIPLSEYLKRVVFYKKRSFTVGQFRELNEHRIKKFKLNQFVDFFISSCFVHFRKPDADIFRVALDIAQVPAEHVVYIEDVQMFVDVARDLGIRSIQHKNYLSTSSELAALGLKIG